jgi:hypothetical protein
MRVWCAPLAGAPRAVLPPHPTFGRSELPLDRWSDELLQVEPRLDDQWSCDQYRSTTRAKLDTEARKTGRGWGAPKREGVPDPAVEARPCLACRVSARPDPFQIVCWRAMRL